ncbi:protein kinase family protein [Flavobacterium frigoris]|uniref:Protein tyrosine kinase n=1 Tax=Flavobacterium frigoris TaxID=229204 RepID=A0A1H9I131_FLAFI|nr:protein kinase [Flavobacterium frigoris]SEQ68314.1 Protein tyrosine kinase [Flavobacterium frigoris]
MIKSIINITDVSCINIVDNEIDLLPIQSINYFENELGSGGFGEVFKVESINGIQTSSYVLKIISNTQVQDHAYETISLLHTKIKKDFVNKEGVIINHYPELLGLPFLVCKAYDEIEEKEIIAFLIHNLNENYYQDFGADNFDKSKYAQTEIPERIYYAFQLVKVIKFLNELNFLHSDISENSIWINNKLNKIALIDYDSGFHIDSQKKPTTLGKLGQWIGSTYRKVLAKEIDSDNLSTIERIDEENWVIANAVFELIFGVSPYFFLIDADEKTNTKYLKKHTWPVIDTEEKTFNASNLNAYQGVIQFYNLLKDNGFEKLINAFNKVFNSGFKNPNKRIKVAEWYDILFEIGEGLELLPNILDFKTNKKTINSSEEEVTFNWKQSKGNKTYINDILINGLNHKQYFKDTTNVELKIVNEFGESIKEINIQANKIQPLIRFFKSDILERIDLTPITLSWDTSHTKKVRITEVIDDLEAFGTQEIDPKENKKIILTAIGNFDEEVNAEIEIKVCSPEIVEFKYEINIEKGIDNIDLFWKTENTNQVKISPRIGSSAKNGQTSIGIVDKTEFTLTATGYFSSVEKVIETQPFPIPLIKTMLIPTPNFNQNIQFENDAFKIPDNIIKDLSINFNNEVNFNQKSIDFVQLDVSEKSKQQIDVEEKTTNLFENLFNKVMKY